MSIEVFPKTKSPKFPDDIISNLPDSILCHILSLIPTVDAVGSCVLSTKWKNLWTNLSILSFNDSDARFGRLSKDIPENIKFANFVNRVLHFQAENTLFKFHFLCHENSKPYDISTWVSVSIMKGVQELDLTIFNGEPVRLPVCFFNSVTLEVLKLSGTPIKIKAPTVVSLPNLRSMKLNDVVYEDDQSITKLIDSCTSLEYLDVDWGDAEDVDKFSISSSRLRYLRYHAHLMAYHPSLLQQVRIINPSHNEDMNRRYLICNTLEELYLSNVLVEGTFCLPNLRELKLDFVKFENDESACNFISSFPSLASLVILDLEDNDMLKISSSTLRDLKIRFPQCIEEPSLGLVLDAPALQNMKFDSWVVKKLHIKDLSSLINASICLDFRQNVHDNDIEMGILFHRLSNVKVLSLSWMCMEGTILEHKFPKFLNLTRLIVEVQYSTSPLLQQFIKNSNGLQDLILVVNKDLHEETDNGHTISWKDPEIVPECLLSSLCRLFFFGFVGSDDDFAMVKYILKNARVMEKMVIGVVPYLDKDIKIDLLQKLLNFNFHKGSEECKMSVFCDTSMSREKFEEEWMCKPNHPLFC